jgi:hypothetical protein
LSGGTVPEIWVAASPGVSPVDCCPLEFEGGFGKGF